MEFSGGTMTQPFGQQSGDSRDQQTGDSIPNPEPVKVCRSCSVQTQTLGAFCPNCGASFEKKSQSRFSRRTKIVAVSVLLAIVLIGGGGITAAVLISENQAREAVAAAAEAERLNDEKEAKAEAAAVAAAEAKQKAEDDTERAYRVTVTAEVEAAILQRANELVAEEVLDGPILQAFCNPLGGGSVDDLSALTTTFECLAANEDKGDGRYSGYTFNATVNWNDGTYTYGLGR
jgi:predicted  nucleic acid-binding Zn-ribbon protein